jgi:hypothetical protein
MRTYLKIELLVTQDYFLLERWQEDVLKRAGSAPCNLIQDFESQEKAFQLARTARAKHWADDAFRQTDNGWSPIGTSPF